MEGKIWSQINVQLTVDGVVVIDMDITPTVAEKVKVESMVDDKAWPIWVMGFVCLIPALVWEHYSEYSGKWERLPDYVHNLSSYTKNWYTRRLAETSGRPR